MIISVRNQESEDISCCQETRPAPACVQELCSTSLELYRGLVLCRSFLKLTQHFAVIPEGIPLVLRICLCNVRQTNKCLPARKIGSAASFYVVQSQRAHCFIGL